MPLEQKDKELAAIGASIGANCRPCIEHHLAAGRSAGLTGVELEDAVDTAHAVRREAVAILSARIDELLGRGSRPPPTTPILPSSKERELVALGVSVGANSHSLLRLHIDAAREVGLAATQIRTALKMAGYVQQHASELTADAVTRALAAEPEESVATIRTVTVEEATS